MRALNGSTLFCECGYAMYREAHTLRCTNPRCAHYEKLFKAPDVELEPVEPDQQTAPQDGAQP
jgi:hypothetical protein